MKKFQVFERYGIALFCIATIFCLFLNIYYFHSSIFGIIIFFFYCLTICNSLRTLFKQNIFSWVLGLGLLLIFISGIGGFLFYLHVFNKFYFVSLLFPALFLFYPTRSSNLTLNFAPQKLFKPTLIKQKLATCVAYLLVLLLFFYEFSILFASRTGAPITSPWEVIPVILFLTVYLFITFLVLGVLFLHSFRSKIDMALLVLFSFLTHSVLLIVFKVAYGQDILRGMAWARYFQNGGEPLGFLVMPVNGRSIHSLIIILSKVLNIDLYWITRPLISILFSIFIPITTFEIIGLIKPRSRTLQGVGSFLSIGLFPYLVSKGTWAVHSNFSIVWFYFSVFLWTLYLKETSLKHLFLALFCTFTTIASFAVTGITSLLIAIVAILIGRTTMLKVDGYSFKKFFRNIIFFAIMLSCIFPVLLLSFRSYFFINWHGIDSIIQFLFRSFTSKHTPFFLVIYHSMSFYILGGLGIFLAIKKKVFDRRWIFISLFVLILLYIDGFIAEYIIVGVGADLSRFIGMSQLIVIPYTSLVFLKIIQFSKYRVVFRMENKRDIKLNFNSRILSFFLLSIIVCPLFTSSFYYSYPLSGMPSISEVDLQAINYVYATTKERFFGLTDAIIGPGALAFYGMYPQDSPGITYWTSAAKEPMSDLYWKLVSTRDIRPMITAMDMKNVDTGYLFLSDHRIKPAVISQINQTLDLYAVFSGPGQNLYVFKLTRGDLVYRYPCLRKRIFTVYSDYDSNDFKLNSTIERVFKIPEMALNYNGSYTFLLSYRDRGFDSFKIELGGKEKDVKLGNLGEVRWVEIGNLTIQSDRTMTVQLTPIYGTAKILGIWIVPSMVLCTTG